MSVLLIDNFDSFTYNLYQYLGELSDQVVVVRNDEISLRRVEQGVFTHIVISPGPGNPTDTVYFGDTSELIRRFYKHVPMLGICLGHQGIGAVLGGTIITASSIMHGKTSRFAHGGEGLFAGLPDLITGMRYHSLALQPESMPSQLAVDAVADDGTVMAFHHRDFPVFGIQFHPESFRTDCGKDILKNFLKMEAVQ